MLPIPECLNDFDWPDSFAARQAAGDLYASDPKLRLIYRAILDARQNTGYSLPIEDSTAGLGAGESVLMGVKHYPEYFAGKAGTLGGGRVGGSLYALFNLEDKDLAGAARAGEIYFPA